MTKKLIGACVFAQSGGPTAVINASAAGVFAEALNNPCITKVYGAAHGIVGILEEDLFDIGQEDMAEIMLLKYTPSSALGSSRHKLKDFSNDAREYYRILEVFRKYNIRYFYYNGGNDSMDTCNKISKFMESEGYECSIIGIPKTVDNDLYGTDHCPGYGSAAKYIATTMMELGLDTRVYDIPTITIIEIMGRNSGWLTAASSLAGELGPDLIYLPEVPFSITKFLNDIHEVCERKNNKCVIAISEGLRTSEGQYVTDADHGKDTFGHIQLGGAAAYLEDLVRRELGVKTRAIEFSLMQRCAAHIASDTDIQESFEAGRAAVRYSTEGATDKMVAFEREYDENGAYIYKTKLVELAFAANAENQFPMDWITENGTGVSQKFFDYAMPLIQGTPASQMENGLPKYAKLKKVKVEK